MSFVEGDPNSRWREMCKKNIDQPKRIIPITIIDIGVLDYGKFPIIGKLDELP